MTIMANASSIPVRNKINTTPKPIMPTTTSFIFASDYLEDVTGQHETLDKTTDPEPIRDGIKRKLAGKGDLPRPVELNCDPEKVPPYQEEEHYTQQSRKAVQDILTRFREFLIKEIDKDMTSHP